MLDLEPRFRPCRKQCILSVSSCLPQNRLVSTDTNWSMAFALQVMEPCVAERAARLGTRAPGTITQRAAGEKPSFAVTKAPTCTRRPILTASEARCTSIQPMYMSPGVCGRSGIECMRESGRADVLRATLVRQTLTESRAGRKPRLPCSASHSLHRSLSGCASVSGVYILMGRPFPVTMSSSFVACNCGTEIAYSCNGRNPTTRSVNVHNTDV